ncbi:hypothetical protein [Schleiferilactobacillus perolens]|jgi:hypothetical protein|uniref:hypothetical protein n=1 Tax=Schleiferilactobacillus perolens TaxID=100468 RepID=UPI0039EC4B19
MIDMKIDSHHYTALDDEEFAEYQRLKKERSNKQPVGVWSLRKTYQYIHRDYKFMNCLIKSEDGKRLLKGIIIPGKNAHDRYQVIINKFMVLWDEHGPELIKIAQRMRPILYPD